jgi:hypothetical protein
MGELTQKNHSFWVQVHGLPLINMTIKNALAIGKGMGNLLKVEDFGALRPTSRSYLRLLVEIDVTKPLKPGFPFHREGGESTWIFFFFKKKKYERLGEYYTSCGLITHKKQGCRSPTELIFPEKYKISLKVTIFSNLLPEPAEVVALTTGESSRSSSSSTQLHGGELTHSHTDNTNPNSPCPFSQVAMSYVKPANQTIVLLETHKAQTRHSPDTSPHLFLNVACNFSTTAAREDISFNTFPIPNQSSTFCNPMSGTNLNVNISNYARLHS